MPPQSIEDLLAEVSLGGSSSSQAEAAVDGGATATAENSRRLFQDEDETSCSTRTTEGRVLEGSEREEGDVIKKKKSKGTNISQGGQGLQGKHTTATNTNTNSLKTVSVKSFLKDVSGDIDLLNQFRMMSSMSEQAYYVKTLTERAVWSRYGLKLVSTSE